MNAYPKGTPISEKSNNSFGNAGAKSTNSKPGSIKAPAITMPKGGGAIKGIGETFTPDAFTGTANYSLNIGITQARGFEPQLAVNYNSGGGNGIFGMGFSLDMPSISIRTERGIPRYNGKDVYMNGGSELVLKNTMQLTQGNWNVYEYLPRVQSAFSLIQHFVKQDGSESYWQITSNQNTVSVYGQTNASRIYNPENPAQIFQWSIEQSVDAKGNKIIYTYKAENNDNVPDVPWEQNRSYNNKYIQNIRYGNYLDGHGAEQFAYEVIFDYGEYVLPGYEPVNKWKYRPDAFSSYASGFEIRTCRRCCNIMLFHFFEELGDPCLVKNVHFDYSQASSYNDVNHEGLSLMNKATLTGYKRSGKKSSDTYETLEAPPVEFNFSEFSEPLSPVFKKMEINNGNIPGFLKNPGFQPIDLNGEGIAGLLYSNNDSLYYCSPQGEGQYDTPLFPLHFPGDRNFSNGDLSFTDLDGNGELDLQVKNLLRNGYYLKHTDGSWQQFVPFKSFPTDIADPLVELADLSHNGQTDAVMVGNNNIYVYPSLGTQGYDAQVTAKKQPDFPALRQDYLREFVGFTDMMGDGLAHRVKISAGSVEIWPDMGYGAFGNKITMGNAPWLGNDFDITRLLLADIDGSGTTDIAYIHQDKIFVYINHCGNYFSDAITVDLPEPYSNTDQVAFADVNGNGTNCLVYTKAGPVMQHYYYDFTGETIVDGKPQKSMKPYLLIEVDNNMGAVNQLQYCSAVKFYLEDKQSGNPWATRLPFPVQVVEKISIIDKINNARFTSSFKFHDGFYDHAEKVFVGFGYVETWDSETYNDASSNSGFPLKKELYVPPVHTKTWYRTGAGYDNPGVMANYKSHFFNGDPDAYDFPDTVFDAAIYSQDSDTLRQAYVALKGQVIRSEIYADDKDEHPDLYLNPYTVTQSNSKVILSQQKGDQPFAVFLVVPRESISYNYERNPHDPGVQQNFTISTDAFGNPLQSCNVFLQRRPANDPNVVVYPEQTTIRGVLTLQQYVQPLQGFLFFDVESEAQDLELSGLQPDASWYFSFDGIKKQVDSIPHIIPHGGNFTSGVQARQISWERYYFWDWNNPNQNPALGVVTSPALLHHREQAVFTKEFSVDVFQGRLIDETAYLDNGYLSNIIYTNGGYFYDLVNSYWWNKGLIQYYQSPPPVSMAANFFYLRTKTENSFALAAPAQVSSLIESTTVLYDDYALFPIKLTQQVDANTTNTVHAQIDYNTAQAKQIIDINNNTTQALYDPLGQMIVSSIFGTEAGTSIGAMTLYDDGLTKAQYQDPGPGSFNDVISNPQKFLQGASTYFYYNLDAWVKSKQPVCSINLTRNFYWNSPQANDNPYCQVLINYTDGMGRDIGRKLNAGPISIQTGSAISSQWQASGRTVYNNKGNPCEVYFPFFSFFPEYEDQQLVPGPPPKVIHYDALSREIRVDTPKGFFAKIEITAWQHVRFDEDDTILDSYFYKNEYPGNLTPNEIDAIKKAVKFYNTPSIDIFDNKGDAFLKIVNNLGNVTVDVFKPLENPPAITAQGIWDNLLSNGYLLKDPNDLYFLTPKFQPYTKGFVLTLDAKYTSILQQIIDILKENCLTSYYATNISGKLIESIDPRIYYNDIINNQSNYNFRYRYTMTSDDPVLTDSADAGMELHLQDIFNSQLWSFSARDYCQLILYDRLQRKTALTVKQITTPGPVPGYDDFNLVETVVYGETTGITGHNLCGQVYQVNDLSGILLNTSYTMVSLPLQTSRQMLADYKTPADWRIPPLLEPTVYGTAFTYNAVKQVLTQSTPDGSVTTNTYDQAAQLKTVAVKFPGNSPVQPIIDNIEYTADGKRKLVKNGNSITTAYVYEETTLRLTGIQSTRYSVGIAPEKVQDIEYYYDPAGNITRTLDNTVEIIFCNNQLISPLADYTYNAIYQLVTATGRQHTGITANTYQNNSPGSFKQCFFGPPPFIADSNKLENYTENYTYDDSGNLVNIQHTASSVTSWSRALPVAAASNRLQNGNYDASGNLRSMDISNNVDLAFNCCENLVRAGIIIRDGQPDDCDYYMYDINGTRTRKVSEKLAQGGTLTTVEDKIYVGNFEVKRNINVGSGGNRNTISERQTLRIMDRDRCVCIIYYTVADEWHAEMEGLRQCRFQLNNNIGSVSMEMDETGQLISYEEYFPYGGTSIITGENETEVKQKEHRYSAKECDDTTGLYYYGRRYYVPWQGRWLNPDPAGTVDGLNLYAFTNGNPVTFFDDDGLMKRARDTDDEKYLDATKTPPAQNKKPKGDDFTSEGERKKMGYFKKGPDDDQSKRFFTEKNSVLGILKFDGREVLFATNYAPDSNLEFPFSGLYNQKGQKIGAHSEDWTTAGFKALMNENNFETDAKKLPAEQTRHVASLKLNYSPCTGCVRTLVNFHNYLKETFGNDTILRIKFLRPYDLPKSLKKTDTQKSMTFLSTLNEFKAKGIVVRLHADPGKKTYEDDAEYNRGAVEKHGGVHFKDLKKKWSELGVARKDAA